MKEYCPYNVPRRNEETGIINKCDMCLERVEANQVPMCVKTCITGAMQFGSRDKILAMAQERLRKVREEFPDAALLDTESVRVIYLITHPRKMYPHFAALDEHRKNFSLV